MGAEVSDVFEDAAQPCCSLDFGGVGDILILAYVERRDALFH